MRTQRNRLQQKIGRIEASRGDWSLLLQPRALVTSGAVIVEAILWRPGMARTRVLWSVCARVFGRLCAAEWRQEARARRGRIPIGNTVCTHPLHDLAACIVDASRLPAIFSATTRLPAPLPRHHQAHPDSCLCLSLSHPAPISLDAGPISLLPLPRLSRILLDSPH